MVWFVKMEKAGSCVWSRLSQEQQVVAGRRWLVGDFAQKGLQYTHTIAPLLLKKREGEEVGESKDKLMAR